MGARRVRIAVRLLAGLILLALPSAAQVQVGDNLSMSLSGNLGFQYAGNIEDGISGHSMGLTGNGNLTGNYYSPNFLNFNVDPFYNRTQSNSVFGSLSNASGISSNVNLFGGSHFPGTVSYNRIYNATDSFGVPGSDVGLAQNTNQQGYGVTWSALVPDMPTLTASYMVNNDSNSILGLEGTNEENDRTLNLMSTYKLDGYRLTGQYLHRNTNAHFNQVIDSLKPVHTLSSSNDFGATVQHALPLAGSFSATWNHLGYDYAYEDSYSTNSSGGSTTLNGNASFHPATKLGVAFNANYNDSLLGSVPEPILNNGTVINMTSLGSFHSVLVGSDVYYQLIRSLGLHGNISHTHQTFLGQTYSATQFFGSANFNIDRTLLKGLTVSLGVVNTVQQTENTGLGFVGTVNYTRKVGGWDLGANFAYAQNVQTVMLVYTTSSYSYLGSVRRRLTDRTYFMAGYSGSHSGITANSGTSSSADRLWTTFMHRGYSLNTYYNKSDGMAVLTPGGLVPVPGNVPPPIDSNAFTSYDSKGWGFNASASPIRRLSISGGYSKSSGETIDPLITTSTGNELINVVFQYRLRKIFVNGGYTRLSQTVGTTSTQPIMVTSYFIGFSRWFNFF